MRWLTQLPWMALALGLLTTLLLLRPVLTQAPFLISPARITVIPAPVDERPWRPRDGNRAATLDAGRVPPGPLQYTANFQRTDVPRGQLGVLALPTLAESRVYLNGLRVGDERLDPRGAVLLGDIRREGLLTGRNRLELIVDPPGRFRRLRAVFVGPMDGLEAAGIRLVAIEHWGLIAATLLGAGGALLGFLLALTRRDRQALAPGSVLALTFAGLAAVTLRDGAGPGLLPWTWAGLVLSAAAALQILLTTGSEKDGWARPVTVAVRLAAGFLVILMVSGPLALATPDTAVTLALWAAGLAVLTGGGGGLVLVLAGKGVRAAWSPPQRAIIALAALSLLGAVVGRMTLLGPWSLLLGPALGSVCAGLYTAAWFASVALRALLDGEAALQQRLSLGRLVREQQVRIAEQQAALEREISLRAVLEERERFSRDIHDGVGGSLTSLLLRARTGSLREEDLESGLERALEDLRLMIDALDHAPAALGVAFSTLRTRITPAFKAAGVALDWSQDDLEGHALKDSRALLQVFRILQEASTNVVRHAGANRVWVRIGWEADRLVVEVEDDGAGSAASGPGNGLRNMAERARRIGGELTAGPLTTGGGWLVRLEAPGA